MTDLVQESYSKRRVRWGSIVFFIAIAAVPLIGVPLYVRAYGWRAADLWLFAGYSFLTTLAITAGYHRLYSHYAYKTNRFVELLFLFFGAGAIQQSAIKWAALHRQHHRYVDTPRDPYNIKQGFWHAHMGWLLFHKYTVDYDAVSDLRANPLSEHQHRHFQTWALVAGVVTPLAIGALYGSVLGAFLFGVCLRLTVVYQSTFCINSVAHTIGSARYDKSSARDSLICALLTNGEGYHNFHHRFPSDYRNGILWHHWDPTKWVIWAASRFGLTCDLRRTLPEQIKACLNS